MPASNTLQSSRIDGEIQTVLNRFLLFGPHHADQRAACTKDLGRIAKGDDLIFHGSKLISNSTLALIGQTLCEVVTTCQVGSSAALSWEAAAPMLEAVLLLLANCCLTDDLRLHNTLLALTGPPPPPPHQNKNIVDDAKEGDETTVNYFAQIIVALFQATAKGVEEENILVNHHPEQVTKSLSKVGKSNWVGTANATAVPQKPAYVPLRSGSIAAVLFGALDLVATLSSNSSDVRAVFGAAGIHDAILVGAIKAYPNQLDVLFGASMTLSTLTTADTLNGMRLVQSGGLQLLVDVNRYCFLNRAKFAAGPAKPELSEILAQKPDASGKKKREDENEQNAQESAEERKEMGLAVERYCQQCMMNLMKVPFQAVDDAMAKLNYGKFGSCVAMDELKWKLSKERKRCNKMLLEYRRQKASE